MHTWILGFLLASAPATTDPFVAPPCPGGGDWKGHGPPDGVGYYCASERDGQLVLNGWSVTFHEDSGKIASACQYKDGVLDGRCSEFDESGRLVRRGFFRSGVPVNYQFFWGALKRPPTDSAADRRAEAEALVVLVGGDEPNDGEGGALAQYIIDRYDLPVADIRVAQQMCGTKLCVSTGRVSDGNIVAFEVRPSEARVASTAHEFEVLRKRVVAEKLAAEKLAVAERKAAEKAERIAAAKAKKEEAKRVSRWRAWANTHLRCRDGTRSDSCVCGRSWQGCCSWHGGVSGCPVAEPQD